MKSTLTSFCFVLTVLASTAQESDQNSTYNRLFVGVAFSPDINYRFLTAESNVQWIKDSREDSEIPAFGFSSGIDIGYNFTQIIGLQTGVQYAEKGFQSKWQDALNPIQPNDPNIPERVKGITKFRNIDIPVSLNITIGKRKLKFITRIGAAMNVRVANNFITKSEYSDGSVEKNNNKDVIETDAIGLTPFLSIGMQYQIGDLITVRAEPITRFAALPIGDFPIKQYNWNAGIKISCLFGFLPR